jgi:hypothetical protein
MTGNAVTVWTHLPFWVINYGLAIVMWSCIGRMLLFFMPGVQPGNYIWRAFYLLTEWAVRLFGFITPMFIRPFWLPLIAAFWLWHVRFALYLVLAKAGMTPTLGGG